MLVVISKTPLGWHLPAVFDIQKKEKNLVERKASKEKKETKTKKSHGPSISRKSVDFVLER